MDVSYWKKRWQEGEIGWHHDEVHPLLVEMYDVLKLSKYSHFFYPFCGKSLDLDFLIEKNHFVTGVEVSDIALAEIQKRIGGSFTHLQQGSFTVHQHNKLTLLQGNYFDLTQKNFAKPIDVVFDRGAFVAIKPEQRPKYAKIYSRILPQGAQIILVAYQYTPKIVTKPPFSICPSEIQTLMQADFEITQLKSEDILENEPQFKERGVTRMVRNVYQLIKKV